MRPGSILNRTTSNICPKFATQHAIFRCIINMKKLCCSGQYSLVNQIEQKIYSLSVYHDKIRVIKSRYCLPAYQVLALLLLVHPRKRALTSNFPMYLSQPAIFLDSRLQKTILQKIPPIFEVLFPMLVTME